MARVELNNLSKSFGSVEVLRDLNLAVEEAEFVAVAVAVAVVGRSGCGRSTLLRISGISKTERKTRARKTASILGLTDLLDRKPSQLSGG